MTGITNTRSIRCEGAVRRCQGTAVRQTSFRSSTSRSHCEAGMSRVLTRVVFTGASGPLTGLGAALSGAIRERHRVTVGDRHLRSRWDRHRPKVTATDRWSPLRTTPMFSKFVLIRTLTIVAHTAAGDAASLGQPAPSRRATYSHGVTGGRRFSEASPTSTFTKSRRRR